MSRPNPSLETRLEEAQETGKISADDADQVRTFASFLDSAGPPPGHADFDQARFSTALREYYPEDYERATGGSDD